MIVRFFPSRSARSIEPSSRLGTPMFVQYTWPARVSMAMPSGRHLRNAGHANGATDRRGQIAAGALQRNDDVVLPQLRIFDDISRCLYAAERDAGLFEDFVPVGHRLCAERFVQNRSELCRIRSLLR